MNPWLSIVGLGEDGLEALTPAARALVDQAEVLIGGERHLAMVPEDGRHRLTWTSPLGDLVDQIMELREQRVCILATGDPMHYGIGVTMAKRLPIEELVIIPAHSAFSLAAARLGWSLAEVEQLTLHGRPLALLNGFTAPGARLLLLSNDGATPAQVAGLLRDAGYGDSRLWVLEHMGGETERVVEATAAAWSDKPIADLNTIAVECRAASGVRALARVPGLPDEAFRSDGQMTKREVRAVTLARLAPLAGQRLWDVGAGCGSIAIEWMRAARGARAVAIERDRDRIALLSDNAQSLGAPLLEIVPGQAPGALSGLAAPDAVFIGGGVTTPDLLDACWEALPPGGRLVANVVSVEGEHILADWHNRHGGDLVRLSVSRAEPVGAFHGWRPLMPVTQYAVTKP